MRRFVLLLLALMLLSGCGEKEAQTQPTETQTPTTLPETAAPETTEATEPPAEPPTEPDPIGDLLATMTLEEKVGQLFFARCPEENAAEDVSTYHLGGYILFDRDFAFKTAEEVLADIRSYQAAAQIPLLIGVDEEGGTVVRASSHFVLREEPFASAQTLYAEGGMERILEDTKEKDALLSAMGVNVNFAPVADVSTDPDDFIYDRAFGQDAAATAEFTAQMITQMTRDNMGSVLKHFPGYGSNVDTHTGIAVDERPMATFLQEDLLPFASFTAGEGKTAIMVSHNIVTCLDTQMPASLSPKVHAFLRQYLGFEGVVMTDGLDMGAVQEYAETDDIAVTALLAGNDMLLICDYKTGIPAILAAVEAGTVTQTQIDTACRRVLTWKRSLGLV